jgi:hypothetical protein
MRRTLCDTLLDLSGSFLGVQEAFRGVRITEVSLDLPIEVSLARRGGEFTFLADVPCWRWRTPFDRQPGRMILHYTKAQEIRTHG